MLLCYSNFYDIFIPFLCSLVGGILAFLGVWVSILNDNKKKKYGPEHKKTLDVQFIYACVLLHIEKYKEAYELLVDLLDKLKRTSNESIKDIMMTEELINKLKGVLG